MPDVDEETLRRAAAYAGNDFQEAREVTHDVFSEYAETHWTLADFLSAVEQAVQKIPQDLRASARVELRGGYDESTELKISYDGKESEAEVAQRVNRALSYARGSLQRERDEYERLKAKFGE